MTSLYKPSRAKIWTLVSLSVIVPIGFYAKFYSGPAASWVNSSLSGVFYEIFWCLLVFLFVEANPGLIATGVFIVTSLLEVLQLSEHPFLEFVRSFFLGQVLIGTSFVWSDFAYYVIGSALGWLWLRLLRNTKQS
jgi:hypothetical protein